jgi:hypothetical protein
LLIVGRKAKLKRFNFTNKWENGMSMIIACPVGPKIAMQQVPTMEIIQYSKGVALPNPSSSVISVINPVSSPVTTARRRKRIQQAPFIPRPA